MNMEEKIKRINELYHLSKERELTESEKNEQAQLRKDYIASVKANLKVQLDNMEVEDENGNKMDIRSYNASLKSK